MSIKVTCQCGKVYTVADSAAGKTGTCKECGHKFKIIGSPQTNEPIKTKPTKLQTKSKSKTQEADKKTFKTKLKYYLDKFKIGKVEIAALAGVIFSFLIISILEWYQVFHSFIAIVAFSFLLFAGIALVAYKRPCKIRVKAGIFGVGLIIVLILHYNATTPYFRALSKYSPHLNSFEEDLLMNMKNYSPSPKYNSMLMGCVFSLGHQRVHKQCQKFIDDYLSYVPKDMDKADVRDLRRLKDDLQSMVDDSDMNFIKRMDVERLAKTCDIVIGVVSRYKGDSDGSNSTGGSSISLDESGAKKALDKFLKEWCFSLNPSIYGYNLSVPAKHIYKPEDYSVGVSKKDYSGKWLVKATMKFKTGAGGLKTVPMTFTVSKSSNGEITISSSDMPR